MKLIECYVSSFGKLKDFRLSFVDGLNVINQENAYGKTTLSIFLKSMFYGLDDSKKDVDNNERKKYKPWNSIEKFGGYLVFEKDGVKYKIERFFGNKESEDEGSLTDLTTGKVFSNYNDLGERIFEIDQGGFLSTAFFSQKDFSFKSNSSLTAKFNTVCDVQDSVAFDKAVSKIKDLAKSYKYSGERGLIPQTKRDILEVEKELDSAKASLNSVMTYKGQADTISEELESCQKQIDKYSNAISVSAKYEAYKSNKEIYEKLKAEQQIINGKIDNADRILNGNSISESELESCKNCINDLNNNLQRKKIIEKDILDIQIESQQQASVKPKTNLVPILSGAIGIFLGIIICFFSLIVGVILAIASTVLCIVSLTLLKKNPKENFVSLGLIDKKKMLLEETNNIILGYQNNLSLFFSRYNLLSIDFSIMLEELSNAYKTKIESQKLLKENIEKVNALAFNPDAQAQGQEIDYNDAKRNLYEKNEELKILSEKLAKLNSIIRERENEANNIPFLESQKDKLTQKLKSQKEQLEILNLTYDFLKKADENLKVRYRAPMQTAFNKYLSNLSKLEVGADVDVDFNVVINEKEGAKPTEYYSKGFRNLFDICKRFALIEVLFDKEKPFIILDDPFCNFDENKIEKSKKLLTELSKEYQIIYFTCHSSRTV